MAAKATARGGITPLCKNCGTYAKPTYYFGDMTTVPLCHDCYIEKAENEQRVRDEKIRKEEEKMMKKQQQQKKSSSSITTESEVVVVPLPAAMQNLRCN